MEQVMTATQASPRLQRRVKDAPTRAAHWWMAGCFVGAYVTGDSESLRLWHVIFGYSLMLALAFRVVWGMMGPQPARLGHWWRRGKSGAQWLWAQCQTAAWKGGAAPFALQLQQGLMPFSALVMVVVLALLPWLGASGYIAYNEWTGDWMAELHELLGNLALAAVLTHVGLLLAGSLLRRQNLAQPMLSGTMPGKGADLVPRNRLWLALLLSACLLGFGAGYWHNASLQLAAQPAPPPAAAAAAAAAGAAAAHAGNED